MIFQYPFISNLLIYTFGAAKQIGGIFVAIIFIMLAEQLPQRNLKNSLIFAAVGLMMLFSSIQLSILNLIPYPAFGMNTLFIMPVASFVLLIGLYNTARSVAFDKQFLEMLKQNIMDRSALFLESIGTAEWKNTMNLVINDLSKSSQISENRIYSELSKEDIQKHIVDVMNELRDQSKSDPK
jgi:hypothetical protein